MLPRASGCSGMTCWRRLRDWQAAGVWTALHRVLLEQVSEAGHLDWSRASLDSAAVVAKRGGVAKQCMVPRRGVTLDASLMEAMWDRFYTAAPERQRRSVERYSGVKRA